MKEREPSEILTVDLQEEGAVKATCEFCKKQYWILPSQGQVAHELPYCVEFELLDILEFLRQNRETKEGRVARA